MIESNSIIPENMNLSIKNLNDPQIINPQKRMTISPLGDISNIKQKNALQNN